jgi:hypothetical protein
MQKAPGRKRPDTFHAFLENRLNGYFGAAALGNSRFTVFGPVFWPP